MENTMSFSTYRAVELFDHTDTNHVQLWIRANIEDCEPGSDYHLIHGVDTFGTEFTVVLFLSAQDADQFDEEYDSDWTA